MPLGYNLQRLSPGPGGVVLFSDFLYDFGTIFLQNGYVKIFIGFIWGKRGVEGGG